MFNGRKWVKNNFVSFRKLVGIKAGGVKEGILTNAEFSAAIFYVVRKESLAGRDKKKVLSIKKFLQDKRKYVKLQEAVDSGALQLNTRWKEAEAFLGLAEMKLGGQERQGEQEQEKEQGHEQEQGHKQDFFEGEGHSI